MILAIDPGVRGCGCALLSPAAPNLLRAAAYVPSSSTEERASAWIEMTRAVEDWARNIANVTQVVVELPRVYQGQKQKGDPNDLIDLAAVVGALCASFDHRQRSETMPVRVFFPYEWKGQAPKEIIQERVKKRLSAAELEAVALPRAKGLAHNVWDAVALGLVHARRM